MTRRSDVDRRHIHGAIQPAEEPARRALGDRLQIAFALLVLLYFAGQLVLRPLLASRGL